MKSLGLRLLEHLVNDMILDHVLHIGPDLLGKIVVKVVEVVRRLRPHAHKRQAQDKGHEDHVQFQIQLFAEHIYFFTSCSYVFFSSDQRELTNSQYERVPSKFMVPSMSILCGKKKSDKLFTT